MRTLILLSHPDIERSHTNRRLYETLRHLPEVEICLVEALYPDCVIDVQAEHDRVARADRLVFHFPLYWYMPPAGLKRWMDEVLSFGWAFGPGGTRLRGKILQLVITTGGPESSYRHDGYNLFTISELLRPLEASANLMGMQFAEPLILFATPNIPGLGAPPASDAAIAAFAARYRALISD